MTDRQFMHNVGGPLVGRRSLILGFLATGVLVPMVGTGTAQATADDWYPIPEESGSVPWW